MSMASGIETARAAAAAHLRGLGFAEEASIVARGDGDDFSEVRIALSLLAIMRSEQGPPVKRFGRRLVGEEC